jgi:hypothetical protein
MFDDEDDPDDDEDVTDEEPLLFGDCFDVEEELISGSPTNRTFSLCNADLFTVFSLRTPGTPVEWSLYDEDGIYALRLPIGRGSVTLFNASPFDGRHMLQGDGVRLFVEATSLRHGDTVYFLVDEDSPSLVALVWRYGSPVIVVSLVAIALMLWRGAIRVGPLVAVPERSRRSLAEQIRGTGHFDWQYGRGASLHAAAVRALERAALSREPSFGRQTADQQGDTLARLSGLDRNTLSSALHDLQAQRPQVLRSTLALLEHARRQILSR